jgi:hypothetical protein
LRDFLNKNISEDKESKLKIIFGCSKEKFRDWIEFCFKEEMSWLNYGKLWNLDHIKPCSSFKLENDDELKKCFKWKNTAPVYCQDNYKKFKNIDIDMEQYYKAKVKLFKKESTQNLIQKEKDKKIKKEKATKKLKKGRVISEEKNNDIIENLKNKKDNKKKLSKKIKIDDKIKAELLSDSDDEISSKKSKTKKNIIINN